MLKEYSDCIDYKNSEGKLVGRLQDGAYLKLVNRKKHLMKMFDGYGIDVDIFNELKTLDCGKIVICETDTKDVYVCTIEKFDKEKILKDFVGPQYFIAGKHLTKLDDFDFTQKTS